jgi:hypothetical protein
VSAKSVQQPKKTKQKKTKQKKNDCGSKDCLTCYKTTSAQNTATQNHITSHKVMTRSTPYSTRHQARASAVQRILAKAHRPSGGRSFANALGRIADGRDLEFQIHPETCDDLPALVTLCRTGRGTFANVANPDERFAISWCNNDSDTLTGTSRTTSRNQTTGNQTTGNQTTGALPRPITRSQSLADAVTLLSNPSGDDSNGNGNGNGSGNRLFETLCGRMATGAAVAIRLAELANDASPSVMFTLHEAGHGTLENERKRLVEHFRWYDDDVDTYVQPAVSM